jgi:hypothetical protein
MRDWAGQASRFEYLAEKGPMVDGVVKGRQAKELPACIYKEGSRAKLENACRMNMG